MIETHLSMNKCSESMPEVGKFVLVFDKPSCGEVWYPAKWLGNKWELYGFEDNYEFDVEPTHWMEMHFDLNETNKVSAGLPADDRSILIFFESPSGGHLWHPASWLGEDDGPAGEFCWAMAGLGYRKNEVNATHWIEMPSLP